MKHSSIEQLVDRQVRKWEFEKTRRAKMTEAKILPVITVSRQMGTHGRSVGKSIAEHLGYDFWDHEILDAMAEHAHLSVSLLESLDERPRSLIEQAIDSFQTTAGISNYMRELSRHVHTIAHHGGSVIMGRGSQFILNPAVALRVRIVSPVEHRVKQFAAHKHIDVHDARKEIARVDAERAAFARDHWARDLDDPCNYDLVVNTRELAIDSAVETVEAAYRHHFGV